MIYLGIGAFTIVLLVFHLMSESLRTGWSPVVEGAGTIVRKFEETAPGNARYFVEVGVALGAGQSPLTQSVATDRQSYAAISEGDRVLVRYRLSADGRRMRVHGLTRIAPGIGDSDLAPRLATPESDQVQ